VYHSYSGGPGHRRSATVPDITSRQHPIVQAFKRAARGESDQVLLDGWHLLRDAHAAGLPLRTVAVAGEAPTPGDATLIARLGREGAVFTVTTAVMDAMSPVRTPTGVVALAERRAHTLQDLLAPPPPLIVAGLTIQDPGNVGAIVRAAEAGGATGVLFSADCADPWGWKALRAAMGSTFRLPVQTGDLSHLLATLRAAGVKTVAAVPHAAGSHVAVNLRGPVALVVGAEGRGLDSDTLRDADTHVSIPMRPPVDSLNVAVAAALLVYEAQRQRTS
jgi:RNA methyltransferase, TrmH family